MLQKNLLLVSIVLFCGFAAVTAARADVLISEDFDTATTNNPWYFFQDACLTASSSAAGANPGTPPGCTANTNYGGESLVGGYNGASGAAQTLPDPSGHGALRFTNGCISSGSGCANGGHFQYGAIISANTYSTSGGLDITFKTLTYRGDSGGAANDGADGMSFFLMDASIATAAELAADPYDAIGSVGGSLAYSCSNRNAQSHYHGMIGAWLGLGIDEYGNFLNGSKNTLSESDSTATNSGAGDNTASGGLYLPGRIGLRGRGNIAYPWLSANYSQYYPLTGLNQSEEDAAVQNTCQTGELWDYSALATNSNATPTETTTAVDDYAALPGGYSEIGGNQIANEYSNGGYGQLNATPITYRIKLTEDGLLTLAYSYNGGAWTGVIQNTPISAVNSGALPSAIRFGFAGSTGGSSNIHEIMCFKATPASAAASSTTGNEKESSKVDAGTQVYFGSYDPTDWTGRLTAYGLLTDGAGNVTGVASLANWDASCVLTGTTSGCPTTGATSAQTAQSPSSRVMLTWNGSGGVPFEWTSGISSAEQTALNAVDNNGQTRLAFLRGDRTNEIPNGSGLYRARDSVLADIVDSSPAWVGPPSQSIYFSYETPTAWKDRLNTSAPMSENSGQSYTAYVTAEQTRQNVVYVGSDDGLLHGFAAGSYNTDSTYNSAGNTGTEVLAYMPEEVLLGIHPTVTTANGTTTTTSVNSTLDFSNPQYGHEFYVDAPPATGDLYYGGAWHTWVVGGLGPGLSGPWRSQGACSSKTTPCATAWSSTTNYSAGSTASQNGANYIAVWQTQNQSPQADVAVGQGEIYALDVTDPTQFAESNAGTLVKGDWIGGTSATTNPGSFTCINVSNCALNLGYTYGTPLVRRLHDGDWALIFGNGIGSSTGDAGIFIVTINPTTGAQLNAYYLSTGVKGNNGIAYVSAVDMDHDHITDYVYAGDLLGNVWRFDLTGKNESSWAVSTGPLFKTPSGQPITTQVVPEFVTVSGATQVMLFFGTGRKFPLTNASATSYATTAQSFYAVWDWNMSAWNALHSSQVSALTATQATTIAGLTSPYTLGTANLANRAMTVDASGNRTFSTTAVVCYAGKTICGTGNTQFGWYMNAPGTNTGYGMTTHEQFVFNPLILSTVVIFNSVVPAIDSPLACSSDLDTGWSYALDVRTGDAISGFWQGYSSSLPSNTGGYQSNATGTMYYAGGAVIYQDTGGQHHAPHVPLPPDISGGRETWVQIR
ncbi:MAG: pilus assembly protein [Steroidobacteraceae bacterium]